MRTSELTTPALLVDGRRLEDNIRTMADALPGPRLRPHVKAHKCTALARQQAAAGHPGFTCATVREMEGMARAGLDQDLLLANEVADASRLGALVRTGARVTVAVDSEATIDAAARAGVPEVADRRQRGPPPLRLPARGQPDLWPTVPAPPASASAASWGTRATLSDWKTAPSRAAMLEYSMAQLLRAAGEVGGELISAGGTGTYDLNTWATEIQAGSYALMDTAYDKFGLPFTPGLVGPVHRDFRLRRLDRGRLRAQGPGHGPRRPFGRGGGCLVLLGRAPDIRSLPPRCRSETGCGCFRPRRSHRCLPRVPVRRGRRRGGRSLGRRPAGMVIGAPVRDPLAAPAPQ